MDEMPDEADLAPLLRTPQEDRAGLPHQISSGSRGTPIQPPCELPVREDVSGAKGSIHGGGGSPPSPPNKDTDGYSYGRREYRQCRLQDLTMLRQEPLVCPGGEKKPDSGLFQQQ